jgi:hypothetical protein
MAGQGSIFPQKHWDYLGTFARLGLRIKEERRQAWVFEDRVQSKKHNLTT